ncbi:FKBP-type peptidyl-prolyl cis-trans isomerase [Candidatus Azambacteria bacterium]|nr:FKBP-type peptidyl-prolyl cis-trans isomerase [Candidatus Azambacteria bacterium]
MKTTIIILAVLIAIAALVYIFYLAGKKSEQPPAAQMPEAQSQTMNKEGVQIEILKQGTGAVAKTGDTVSVHYVGALENGTKFDSSIDRGIPFEFTLGAKQVIPGWDIGVEGMKIGEKRKLTIPSELAYGSNGIPGHIPPDATLIFEVELLGISAKGGSASGGK